MWNYGDIDRYITVEHLTLIIKAFPESIDKRFMIQSIGRDRSTYVFLFTDAGRGFSIKFEIKEDNTVIASEPYDKWMS